MQFDLTQPDSATPEGLNFQPAPVAAAAGVPVAPLIDIVFLLICFFMLATQLIEARIDPTVTPPIMTADALSPELPTEVILNLREDGAVSAGGEILPRPQDVTRWLREHRLRSDQGLPRVVIRADRAQRFGRLDLILKACRDAGAEQVVIRTRRPNP